MLKIVGVMVLVGKINWKNCSTTNKAKEMEVAVVVVWWERPFTPLGAYTLTTEARDPPATSLAHPSFLSRSLTLFLDDVFFALF